MRIKSLGLMAGTSLVLSFSALPATVLALGNTHSPDTNPNTTVGTNQGSPGPTTPAGNNGAPGDPQGNNTTGQGQANTNTTVTKTKVCEKRQKAINNILSHIVTRGEDQLNLFSTIAQRVETFATNKNVTVANYDQLVATLNADKAKASSDLDNMKATDTLDCNSADPHAVVDAFKADLQQEISDLKTYKTDVKNLIVAVKTAVGSTDSGSNTGSGSHSGTTPPSGNNNTNTGGNQ